MIRKSLIQKKRSIYFLVGLSLVISSVVFLWERSYEMSDLTTRNGLLYLKFSDVPFTGTISGFSRTESGKEVGDGVKGKVKNGKKEGLWTYHFRSIYGNEMVERLVEQGSYKNDKKEGLWIYYYYNGQLEKKGSYKNDKEDGPWTYHYKYDGQLEKEGIYREGRRESLWVYYHENGQLKKKTSFKNDAAYGPRFWYHDNGQVGSKGSFENGKKKRNWVFYYYNGKLESNGWYKNDKREGLWVEYFKDGTVKHKGLWERGKLIKVIEENPTPKHLIPPCSDFDRLLGRCGD